jgi:hypothetical protein
MKVVSGLGKNAPNIFMHFACVNNRESESCTKILPNISENF